MDSRNRWDWYMYMYMYSVDTTAATDAAILGIDESSSDYTIELRFTPVIEGTSSTHKVRQPAIISLDD